MSKGKGRYRIQAVAEMTGVPAATLRAWERRYGLPSPARTASAYRLYSDDDITMVRRVRDLCAQGMAPAEAARLVLGAQPEPVPARASASEDVCGRCRERILDAIGRLDSVGLEREVRATLHFGSATQLLEQVVVPVMTAVGDRWQQGAFAIAHEHLASEIIGSFARDLLRLIQPGEGARLALLACFPAEAHVLPLYVAGAAFAQLGFRAVLLGAQTPFGEIARAVADLAPDVVGLSLTTTVPPRQLDAQLRELAGACAAVPFVIGGRAAAEHAGRIRSAGGLVAPEELSRLGEVLRAVRQD